MGFFDWIMHGLGVEETEKGEKKSKKDKKTKTVDQDDKYVNFNLHEKIDGEESKPTTQNSPLNNFGIQTESNIIMVEPKSHSEIQQVVDYLKQGQSVAVNLEGLSSGDMQRILDFFSGAIYGLNGSIHRWHGDLFLLAPEGHKILKKQ
jgi:FtsZ-interacting cell division protein YlmF